MKTKVLVDNKTRIRKGLEPIQPSVATAEFSIDALNEGEREWVAKHYSDNEDSIYVTNPKRAHPKDLLIVEEPSDTAVMAAIRERVSSEHSRREKAKTKKQPPLKVNLDVLNQEPFPEVGETEK